MRRTHSPLLTHGATLAFVDIGGDRHGDTVVRLIASDALQDVPVVVVKSQMLQVQAQWTGGSICRTLTLLCPQWTS